MKKGKRFIPALLLIVLALVSATMFACTKKVPNYEPPEELNESGIYYYDTDLGDTYYVTLNDRSKVHMSIMGEDIEGNYAITDGVFEFSLGTDANISATYENEVITLTYNGSSMRFLRAKSYTVSYETGEGSSVSSVKVTNGKTVSKPADPTRSGYAFIGWYTDADYTTPFAFGATPVTSDITLYARWSDKLAGVPEYTVNFDVNGSREVYTAAKTVGGKAYNLPAPSQDGYTFAGWWVSDYESADKLTYRYNGGVLNADTTLFALFTAATEGNKLATPAPSVVGNTVSWDEVEGKTTYAVKVVASNGMTLVDRNVGSASVTVPFDTAAAGECTITVKAIAPNPSNNSDEATRSYNNKALGRVSNLRIVEPAILVYDAVDGAENYNITVKCGNPQHKHTNISNGLSTYFDFSSCQMKEGGISFTVTATAAGRGTSTSATFFYNRVLDKIDALYFNEDTESLSWNAVAGAVDYTVTVTDGSETYKFTTFGKTSVSLKEYAASQVKVSVVPTTSGYNSPAAAEYTYARAKLAAPKGLKVSGNILSWNAVAGATSYTVAVNGQETTGVNATEFDLSAYTLTSDVDYAITVKAVGATSSLWSDALNARYYSMSPAVKYENGKLVWHPVIGAGGYRVRVNSEDSRQIAADASETEIELTQKGENTIAIQFTYVEGTTSPWIYTTVYAYEIVFDSRQGTEAKTMYKAMGDVLDLPVSTREGYKLSGWYNVPGAAAANGAVIANGSLFSAGGDVILYAGWAPNPYTVTYSVGTGESVANPNYTVSYNEHYVLDVPTTTDTSKSFAGWYKVVNGNNVYLTDSYGVSVKPWEDLAGATVYPNWLSVFRFELQTEGEYKDTYAVTSTADASRVSKVRIPETYNGKPVTIVEGYAFRRATTLKTIEIPDTVRVIYANTAFEGCINLEDVVVYETGNGRDPVYSSYNGALYEDNEVSDDGKTIVYVPAAKTGNYVIANGTKTVGHNSFSDSRVSSVTVPSSVTNITAGAFKDCKTITAINFSLDEGEELNIGEGAFDGCRSLSSITIPARFKSFEPEIFGEGVVLASIFVAEDHEVYSDVDGMLCNKAGDTIVYCPPARRGAIRIPLGIRRIGEGAFKDCNKLTAVTIPNFVTSIGEGAFEGCSRVATVTFAGGASRGAALTVAANAFKGCTSLNRVTFENNSNVTSLGAGFMSGCNKITSFEVPSTVTAIAAGAFANCANLLNITVSEDSTTFSAQDSVLYNKNKTKIIYYSPNLEATTYTIPASVTELGAGVFEGNVTLEKVIISAGVTSIESAAFKDCTNLKMVVFVNGTAELTIGESAFENCSSLEDICSTDSADADVNSYAPGTPARLVSIGKSAFVGINAREVVLTEGLVTIGAYAFSECKLTEVNLPASVQTIGERAFADNESLETFEIAENSELEMIGKSAFAGAYNLMSFEVPASVTRIGDGAFAETDLSDGFTFESGRTATLTVGVSLFEDSSVETVNFPAGTVLTFTLADDTLYTPVSESDITETNMADMSVPEGYALSGGMILGTDKGVAVSVLGTYVTNVTSYEIPATVKTIGSYAFKTSAQVPVTFEAGGTEDLVLADYAFSNSAVTSITFPARLKTIGRYGVYSCKQLTTVTFTDDGDGANKSRLTSIGYYGFGQDSKLTSLTLPRSVKSIDSYAFYNVPLDTLTLNDGLETVGGYLFGAGYGASKATMTSLTIPATVKKIGTSSFAGLAKAKTITFAKYQDGTCSIEVIGDWAFKACSSLTTITLPASLGGSAYNAKQEPNGELARSLFSNCTKLEEVIYEDGCPLITICGDEMFYNCTSYVNVTFPVNAKVFGDFMGMFSIYPTPIEKIELPAKMTAEGMGYLAPALTNITEVTLAAGSAMYQDSVGAIYSINPQGVGVTENTTVTLVFYPGYIKNEEYTVLPGTTEIGNSAFMGHQYVKKVNLPEGLKKIGETAFAAIDDDDETTALEEINIPSTVTDIGDEGFARCSNLKAITFDKNSQNGTSLKSIGWHTFENCTSLVEVALPDSLTALGYNRSISTSALGGAAIFYGCSNLKKVTLPRELPTILAHTFAKCTKLEEVIVPEGSALARIGEYAFYGAYVEELDFTNATNLTQVSEYAFANSNISSVKFSDVSALTIGENAFVNSELTSFELTPNIVEISANAFKGLSGLEEVDVKAGGNLQTIGDYAFYGTSITSFNFENVPYLIEIGNYAFAETELGTGEVKTIALADSVYTIGDYAFNNVDAVLGGLPASIEYIGKFAFENNGVTAVTVYGNDTVIGEGAFYNCESLEDVTLNSGVYVIGSLAFGNTAITSITLPDTIYALEGNPFAGCAIQTIGMETAGADIIFDKGMILNGDKTILYYVSPETSGEYKLDDSITTLMPSALAGTKITKVTLPANLTEISDSAFRDCKELTEVVIGKNITYIGANAFDGCTKLSSVTFEAGGTLPLLIGEKAFFGCTALKTIQLPHRLRSKQETIMGSPFPGFPPIFPYQGTTPGIGISAFEGSGLVTVTTESKNNVTVNARLYENSLLHIGQRAFYGCADLESVQFGGYLDHDYNSNSNLDMPEVYPISAYAFANCTKLKTVDLPRFLDPQFDSYSGIIGQYAFYNCTSLKSFPQVEYLVNFYPYCFANSGLESFTIIKTEYVDESLVDGRVKFTIQNNAFNGCTSLTTFTANGIIQQISGNPFAGCTNLTTATFNGDIEDMISATMFDGTGVTSITIGVDAHKVSSYSFSSWTADSPTINLVRHTSQVPKAWTEEGYFGTATVVFASEPVPGLEPLPGAEEGPGFEMES